MTEEREKKKHEKAKKKEQPGNRRKEKEGTAARGKEREGEKAARKVLFPGVFQKQKEQQEGKEKRKEQRGNRRQELLHEVGTMMRRKEREGQQAAPLSQVPCALAPVSCGRFGCMILIRIPQTGLRVRGPYSFERVACPDHMILHSSPDLRFCHAALVLTAGKQRR